MTNAERERRREGPTTEEREQFHRRIAANFAYSAATLERLGEARHVSAIRYLLRGVRSAEERAEQVREAASRDGGESSFRVLCAPKCPPRLFVADHG